MRTAVSLLRLPRGSDGRSTLPGQTGGEVLEKLIEPAQVT